MQFAQLERRTAHEGGGDRSRKTIRSVRMRRDLLHGTQNSQRRHAKCVPARANGMLCNLLCGLRHGIKIKGKMQSAIQRTVDVNAASIVCASKAVSSARGVLVVQGKRGEH
eukprot:6212108-Pleurochrysis_carterae.AAC.2